MIKIVGVLIIFPMVITAQIIQTSKSCDSQYLGIVWSEAFNWEQVKINARENNKFIFVDVFASWCAPCKKMEEEVYKDRKVGEVLNSQFISIKVQIDKTPIDNERVKNWYSDAHIIEQQYKPEGYPCFLFFSPQGKLVYRGVGFQTTENFISMAQKALADPIGRYESEVILFNEGKLDYVLMPDLARMARKKNQRDLSIKIAKKYKQVYLDYLDDKAAFTKDNLLFVAEFYNYLLDSKDRFFQLFYKQSDSADKIMDYKIGSTLHNVSNAVVNNIIIKEEVKAKIYRDGIPITTPDPDWTKIKGSIANKYTKTYAIKILSDQQILYYQIAKDWKNYVAFVNKKIKMYPPKMGGKMLGQFGDEWHLNQFAWTLFEECDNKKILSKALSWCDLAISLDTSYNRKAQYLDTKANLLYRMGRIKEAVVLQAKAVDMSNQEIINLNLQKMRRREPTWKVK